MIAANKRMPFFPRVIALVAGLIFPIGIIWAEPYLYVAHFASDDVTVISIPGHEVVSRFSVGTGKEPEQTVNGDGDRAHRKYSAHIDDVIGSPDGRVLYVNRGIDTGHKLGYPEEGEIVAVSTASEEVLWRLPIDDGWPHHLSLSNDGRYLYAPMFDRPYVTVVDTQRVQRAPRLDTPWGGHGTRLSPDGERLYVGSILTSSLYVVDVEENRIVDILSFRDGVRPFAFDDAESTLYVQLSRLHGFVVADLKTGEPIRTIRLPGLPEDFEPPVAFPHNVNHGLELSPDERYLVAAGTAANKAYIFSHPDLELVEVVEIGNDANWVVFSPDSKYAYVSNRSDNTVSVISMQSLEEIERVPTGGQRPGRMRVIDVPERR